MAWSVDNYFMNAEIDWLQEVWVAAWDFRAFRFVREWRDGSILGGKCG